MRTAILITVCLISLFSLGQSNSDKLVLEVSPFNATIHSGFYFNLQGKVSYSFNKYLSVSARHNQEILGGLESAIEKLDRSQLRRNSLSDLSLGITLCNTENRELIQQKKYHQKHGFTNCFN